MRIATWNVNSWRARAERVEAFVQRQDVDVLLLQETKCRDDQVPALGLSALGYEVAHVGTSAWNGVAIASRIGLDDVTTGFGGQPAWGDPPVVEARAIGATCAGVRVWSLYVPNGRELGHPHYDYKLAWLSALADAAGQWLAADPALPLLLAGDWNVAPRDVDVWDRAVFEGSTHVSESERAALGAIEAAGLTDVALEPTGGAFTYWDYQRLRFPRREGMRIDLALGSAALADRVSGAAVDRDERKGKGASDHAPLVVDLAA